MFDCLSRRFQTRPRQARRRPPRRARIEPSSSWEHLENRLALPAFYVNSLLDLSLAAGVNSDTDLINGLGSVVTLRSAIQAPNNRAGPACLSSARAIRSRRVGVTACVGR
jgi:hypothetical protein